MFAAAEQGLQDRGRIGDADENHQRRQGNNRLHILPERAATGNQMALKNIHDRLQAQYGMTARLTTHRAQDFFTAYLSYPFT